MHQLLKALKTSKVTYRDCCLAPHYRLDCVNQVGFICVSKPTSHALVLVEFKANLASEFLHAN